MKKHYAYHIVPTEPEKLLEVLNEKGQAGFRAVSIQLDRPRGGVLIIFESEEEY
jgi:hypothetical protein